MDNNEEVKEIEKEEQVQEQQPAPSMSNNIVSGFLESKKKAIKLKLLAVFGPILGTALLYFLIFASILVSAYLLISLIMSMLDTIYVGTDRMYNLFQYGSFRDSDDVFAKRLKEEYEEFNRKPNHEGNLDIPLILSTINYGRVLDPTGIANTDDSSVLPSDLTVIEAKDVKAFYKMMNNELGVPYSLYPPDKKLLGHLIDVKFTGVCVKKPTLANWNLKSLGSEAVDSAYEISALFGTMFADTTFNPDSSLGVFNLFRTITGVKAFQLVNDIWAYKQNGQSFVLAEYGAFVQGWENQNPVAVLQRIAENSEKPDCADDEIAFPKVTYFNNYDLYREYLIGAMDISFVHRMYVSCETCSYQNYDDATKRIVAERMVDEIFSLKDSYEFLDGEGSSASSIYIPGGASFIFDNNLGERALLRLNEGGLVSSGFSDRRQFEATKNGQPVMVNDIHGGTDFALVSGTPLYAMMDGEVVATGCNLNDGYGNFVKIKHELNGEVIYTMYAHLSEILVQPNSLVGGGQEIAKSGGATTQYCAGRTSGPHLHFEVRDASNVRVDSIPYLRGILQGSSEYATSQTYLSMNDYKDLEYCDPNSLVGSNGSMPIALGMIGRKLNQEIDINTLVPSICSANSANKYSYLSSDILKSTYKIQGEKVLNVSTGIFDTYLNNKQPLLISVKGGHFNLLNNGNDIVILQKSDKYLVLDPYTPSKNGLYSKADIENLIIPYINNGVWAFKGVE